MTLIPCRWINSWEKVRELIKTKWDEVRKKLDDLERTGKLDWRELSKEDIELVLANIHKQERKRWDAPAAAEIERRRHRTIIRFVTATLIVTVIGALVTVFQLITNCGK